jgi:hypothetical protein
LNLYAYCANDPINHTDPSGLGFFSFLKRLFGKVVHAFKAAVVAFVTAFITGGNFRTARMEAIRAFVSDLGFRTRTWRPMGTPPTFPTGGVTLSQIFQGTILAPLFPGPQDMFRFIIPINGFMPVGPCTFNINIFGARGELLSDIQNEISRIFRSRPL